MTNPPHESDNDRLTLSERCGSRSAFESIKTEDSAHLSFNPLGVIPGTMANAVTRRTRYNTRIMPTSVYSIRCRFRRAVLSSVYPGVPGFSLSERPTHKSIPVVDIDVGLGNTMHQVRVWQRWHYEEPYLFTHDHLTHSQSNPNSKHLCYGY